MGLCCLFVPLTIAALESVHPWTMQSPEYWEQAQEKQKEIIIQTVEKSRDFSWIRCLSRGGRVAFELPAENELWNDETVKEV